MIIYIDIKIVKWPLTAVMMPTNITSVMYVYIRMVASITYIRGGFDYYLTKLLQEEQINYLIMVELLRLFILMDTIFR